MVVMAQRTVVFIVFRDINVNEDRISIFIIHGVDSHEVP